MVTTRTGREVAKVSIAHSGELVVCAITDLGSIGIDVEYFAPQRRIVDIAETTFGPNERAAVSRGGAAAFYKIWTLREAMAKATGLGLVTMAAETDLFAAAPSGKAWSATVQRRQWTFFYRRLFRDYALGFALQHARRR
jgi:phosphopantetheinyl transferase